MKNTFSLCFLTFVCFLVIGYSTSTFLFFTPTDNTDVANSNAADKNIQPITPMKNGQRNILLVQVDSITNEKPSLQGVWLLTYLQDDNNLNFLPVFPSGKSSISDAETKLYQSFGLQKENGKQLLDQMFIDELKKENYRWSGYLIFDRNTQEKMQGFFTGKYQNNESQPAQLLPDPMVDASGAFTSQLSSIKTACQYLSKSQDTDWPKFLFLMSNQYYSDFDAQQLLLDWNLSAASERGPNCQFPTLQRLVNANYVILLSSVMK